MKEVYLFSDGVGWDVSVLVDQAGVFCIRWAGRLNGVFVDAWAWV